MNIPSNGKQAENDEEFAIQVDLDEEALVQLDALLDKTVLSMTLWTQPLAASIDEDLSPEEQEMLENVVDVDFYFEDNLLLELYSAMLYESEDEPYVRGIERIADILSRAVEGGLRLTEVAEEAESGAPIFIFEDLAGERELLIVADGWIVDTWDVLPEEE